MLIVMMIQGNWLFCVMIVPGMIASLSNMLLSAPRNSSEKVTFSKDNNAYVRHDAECERGNASGDINDAAVLSSLPRRELEATLTLDADHLMWRRIVFNWLAPHSYAVAIGWNAAGPYLIDLRAQGPHALVAGTTGSGKSVLLQSWCLALAANIPPNELQFVFLDFKGGSTFHQLSKLPHAIGNVCDLNLKHAMRALEALERELRRREKLVADAQVSSIEGIHPAQPRLIIIIDEFHALKDLLPDYMGRLNRIAAQGRSLGMHLIACTQNPSGQVNADMKANISLNICLRVRDGAQSRELIGDARAAAINPNRPGIAYCNDGAEVAVIQCTPVRDIDCCVDAIRTAYAFIDRQTPPSLFTAPLVDIVSPGMIPLAKSADAIPFALGDDGTRLHTVTMTLLSNNIGVFGPRGHGKTTVLNAIIEQAMRIDDWDAFYTTRIPHDYATVRIRHDSPPPPPDRHRIWFVDDADDLFEPFCTLADAQAFMRALADPRQTVVFAAERIRHIRIPEQCPTRIVFPYADRATDLMTGVPSSMLNVFDTHDMSTPGRAIWINGAVCQPVQCMLPRGQFIPERSFS